MAAKIEAYIKLQVPAGQANPSPPVGPAPDDTAARCATCRYRL